MKKQDITNIFARTRRILFQPEAEWQAIRQENIEGTDLFRNYLVPLSGIAATCALLLQLRVTSPFYAICTGLILFVASVAGTLYHVPGIEGIPLEQGRGSQRAITPSCRLQLGDLHPVPLPSLRNVGRLHLPVNGDM